MKHVFASASVRLEICKFPALGGDVAGKLHLVDVGQSVSSDSRAVPNEMVPYTKNHLPREAAGVCRTLS